MDGVGGEASPGHTLRVLYSFPHPLGAPGIGTTAYQQVASLRRLGCDVTVWCTRLAQEPPAGVRVVETMRRGRLRVPQRVVGVDRSYRYHDWLVARQLRANRGRFDAVHVWPLGGVLTLRAAAYLGIRGLREVPNTHTENAFEQVARELALLGLPQRRGHSHTPSSSKLAREAAEYTTASALLVPSEQVASTFVARGYPEERLLLHRYGYDPERFRAVAGERPARPFTAVFAGAGEPRKGLHYALQAWRAAGVPSGAQFLICGRIEPDYRALLQPLLTLPGVRELDFCDGLPKVLAHADVLVLPSVEEGSALVTYEAMACGAVPLVSGATGAPCRHEVDALIHAPRDVKALTRHLARVCTDLALLEQLRAGALRSAQHLTWDDSARRLVRAYRGDGTLASQRPNMSSVDPRAGV